MPSRGLEQAARESQDPGEALAAGFRLPTVAPATLGPAVPSASRTRAGDMGLGAAGHLVEPGFEPILT